MLEGADLNEVVFRNLDYVEMTDSNQQLQPQKIYSNDVFLEFIVANVEHTQIYVKEGWIDYLSLVSLQGEIKITGNLIYNKDFVVFSADGTEASRLPAIIYDLGTRSALELAIDPTIGKTLEVYSGNLKNMERSEVSDVEVTFEAIHLVYSLNAPMTCGGEVLSIREKSTGKIIYNSAQIAEE